MKHVYVTKVQNEAGKEHWVATRKFRKVYPYYWAKEDKHYIPKIP